MRKTRKASQKTCKTVKSVVKSSTRNSVAVGRDAAMVAAENMNSNQSVEVVNLTRITRLNSLLAHKRKNVQDSDKVDRRSSWERTKDADNSQENAVEWDESQTE